MMALPNDSGESTLVIKQGHLEPSLISKIFVEHLVDVKLCMGGIRVPTSVKKRLFSRFTSFLVGGIDNTQVNNGQDHFRW